MLIPSPLLPQLSTESRKGHCHALPIYKPFCFHIHFSPLKLKYLFPSLAHTDSSHSCLGQDSERRHPPSSKLASPIGKKHTEPSSDPVCNLLLALLNALLLHRLMSPRSSCCSICHYPTVALGTMVIPSRRVLRNLLT